MMDLSNMTLAGLATIGIVNVITFLKPNIKPEVKFIISFVAAFAVLFVPDALGTVLLDKLKLALEITFATSGAYKLVQKAGGQ